MIQLWDKKNHNKQDFAEFDRDLWAFNLFGLSKNLMRAPDLGSTTSEIILLEYQEFSNPFQQWWEEWKIYRYTQNNQAENYLDQNPAAVSK